MLISLLLSQPHAFADPEDYPTINAQYFRPAIDSQYFVWVNESNPGKHQALNFRSALSHASKPLVYTSWDDQRTELLRDLTQLDLVTGYTLGNLRFGMDVPIIIRAEGALPNGESLSDTNIGDLVFDVKYRLTNPNQNFGAAVVLRSTLPTSTSIAPIGSDDPILEGELSADIQLDDLIVAINVGHRQQSDWKDEQSVFGSQLFVRGGLGYKINDQQGAAVEMISSRLYEINENSPAFANEALLSGWNSFGRTIVRGGVGVGIGAGIGTPEWRTILSVEYQPKIKPKDTDNDGIIDKTDACPNEPEDIDSVADEDGCPDPTEVKLTFVDQFGNPIVGKPWKARTSNSVPFESANPEPETSDSEPVVQESPLSNIVLEGTSGTPFRSQAGDFVVVAEWEGYRTIETPIQIKDGEPIQTEIKVELIMGKLSVNPKDSEGKPIEGVIWIVGEDNVRHKAGDVVELIPGKYTVEATAPGFKSIKKDVELQGDVSTTLDLEMKPTKAEVKDGRINFEGIIHFKTNSAIIDPKSFALLNDIGDILRDFAAIKKIRIEGHTDNRGSNKKNKKLSQERAEAVRQYLIRYDILAERMISEGFGEEKPIADNKSKAGRQSNRRVEIHILEVNQSEVRGIHDIKLDSDIKKGENLDSE